MDSSQWFRESGAVIEKNIVGIYSIRERYPIFQHQDNDEKQIDPNRYGAERVRSTNVSRDSISEHEPLNQWRSFSEQLRERRQGRERGHGEQDAEEQETDPSEDEAAAQQRTDQNIRDRVLALQQVARQSAAVAPADRHFQQGYERDQLQLSAADHTLQHLQHYLSQVQTPVPDEHLKAFELSPDPDLSFSEAGALKLGDVMTRKVVCLLDSTSLEQAASICNQRGISGLPILNRERKLVGLVSMTDVIQLLVQQHRDGLLQLGASLLEAQTLALLREPIHKFMSRDVVTAPPEMNLREACRLMLRHKIHRLVITQDEQVKGLFSARDAVRVLSHVDLHHDVHVAHSEGA